MKKAISPLFATLILIGITVVGGLLVYGVSSGLFGSLFSRGEITVESINLIKDTGGNVVFSITLKNSGNRPIANDGLALNITRPGGGGGGGEPYPANPPFFIVYAEEQGTGHVTVTTTSDGGVTGGPEVYNIVAAADLQPGRSIAVALSSPDDLNADDYIIGNSYYVTVMARFSDGSLFTATVSVTCRQG